MASHFFKYQANGNDYLVIDSRLFNHDDNSSANGAVNNHLPLASSPSPEAIRAICDPHWGPGSDGILLKEDPITPDEKSTAFDTGGGATYGLRIFNPDGSEAEKSGNGLRIFARYLFETEPSRPRRFSIATKGGLASIVILAADGSLVRVDMGKPDFGPIAAEGIEAQAVFGGQPVRMSRVSMGNPHCVLRGLPVDESTAKRIGPIVEHDQGFPNRTNVQLLEVLARDEIRIEIWERGAGYTLSSGSSSCAAAAVARKLALVDDSLRVKTPGGVLSVDFVDDRALLTGPVQKICEGAFSQEFALKWGLLC